MKPATRILIVVVIVLAYIASVTFIFENTINEVSDTLLTVCGVAGFLLLTWLTVRVISRLIKSKR